MTRPQIPLTISEADFQQTVTDLMTLMQWTWCHYRPLPDRRGKWQTPLSGTPGCPDLIAARYGVVLLIELKRHGAHPSPAQRMWLDRIGEHGRCWTPTDWNSGEIPRTLRHLGRPVVVR